MLVDECAEQIEQTFSKFAILLRNGSILRSTIESSAIDKIYPVLKKILNKELLLGTPIVKSPLVFYQITENVVIILITRDKIEIVDSMFELLAQKYALALDQTYPMFHPTLKHLAMFSIFSASRQAGPEPLGWWEDVDQDVIFKYSTSSLLLLVNEIDGASRRTLNFHPFISEKRFGIIYLFQIPAKDARGNAFDASILILTDYKYRSILYNYHSQLELILNDIANQLIAAFLDDYSENVQAPIAPISREAFARILKQLHENLAEIPVDLSSIEE